MPATATYTTINGQLVYETRGGVETYYVSDPQGSLIECHDANGNTVYEAWYWPYGELRTSTGTKSNNWGYIGLQGYLTDLANLLYVRARYYRPDLTRWLTVDPLWPNQLPFCYCANSPQAFVDPTGFGYGTLFPYGTNSISTIPTPPGILSKLGPGIIGVIIAMFPCMLDVITGADPIDACLDCCNGFFASAGSLLGSLGGGLLGTLGGGLLGGFLGWKYCPDICPKKPPPDPCIVIIHSRHDREPPSSQPPGALWY